MTIFRAFENCKVNTPERYTSSLTTKINKYIKIVLGYLKI